jgi:hypothetical protein
MASKSTIDRLSRSIEKLADQVELRHGTFEPAECWVLNGDEAHQVGRRDGVLTAAELEARPIPRTQTGVWTGSARHRVAGAEGRGPLTDANGSFSGHRGMPTYWCF